MTGTEFILSNINHKYHFVKDQYRIINDVVMGKIFQTTLYQKNFKNYEDVTVSKKRDI